MFSIADVVTATQNVFNSLPPGFQRDYVAQNQFSHQLMGALAPSTLNTKYIPAWAKYAEWLASYHIRDPISETTENTVAAYLSHLITVASNRNTGDYAIQMATAAIQFKFNSLGMEGPVSSPYIELLNVTPKPILLRTNLGQGFTKNVTNTPYCNLLSEGQNASYCFPNHVPRLVSL